MTAYPILDTIPHPEQKRLALQVKPAAERALRRGHPWVFEDAIRKQSHNGQTGDLAVIFDQKQRFLAIGLYDPDSPIRIKVLHHGKPATIDHGWFAAAVSTAAAHRAVLQQTDTTGHRLIHGENDGLPGLIVDRYAQTLVIKLYSAAWIPHLHELLPGLDAVGGWERVVLRLSRATASALEDTIELYDGQMLRGDPPAESIIFQENGLLFAADVVRGHKTGFFFDQRDNRQTVGALACGKRVLDVFAYTGGFSVYAAAGGASHVVSMDISQPALEAARHNFTLNQHQPGVSQTQHSIMVTDAFDGMEMLRQDGERFDMIIVDPPAFAKRKDEIPGARAAYQRLVETALPLLSSDGHLVMASCSSRISAPDFYELVQSTVQRQGYSTHDVQHHGHALDHPVGFPEGRYLKCWIAQIRHSTN